MATTNKSAKDLPQLPAQLVEQLASFVKTEQDLSLITNQLMKQVVERALQAELSHHLEVDSATGNANSRNGFMGKTLKGTSVKCPYKPHAIAQVVLNPRSCAKGKQDLPPLMTKY